MTAWYAVLLGAVIVALGAFLVAPPPRRTSPDAIDRDLRPAATQIASGYATEGAPEASVDVSAHGAARRRPRAAVLDPARPRGC